MTINRPIETRKQNTPKEIIKKNIPKEIKKQKTPKEIKNNIKTSKKRKQKTPKEIKLSPKTIEQRGGTFNSLNYNLKTNTEPGKSQPIPQNNSQQKSSIMTESEFMKKYGITEKQINQVKSLLLSNAFPA